MTAAELIQIHAWVETYAESHRQASAGLPPPIALKLEHTRRVAENARLIAREMNWPPEDIHTSEALGWLHDVGRFAQYAEHGHFHDATSVDHGLRGVQVVRDSGILDALPDAIHDCLLEGIRHHNAQSIPGSVPPHALPFLKLVRDADKLDIYRVVAEEIERDGFRELASMWPHIDLDGPVSARVLQEVRSQPSVDIAILRSLADFIVLQISWVRDLNCAPSFAMVRDRRLLEALVAHLPADSAAQEYYGEMRAWLGERAAARGQSAPST